MFISNWDEKLELLKEYLKEHDGKYPRQDESYKGVFIGAWVNTQRTAYNRGEILPDGSRKYASFRLSKERIDKLNDMSFLWSIGAVRSDDLWNKNYELLKEYLKEHDGKYPRQDESYKGVFIGAWVNTQRTMYNSGEILPDGSRKYASSQLSKERIDKLNDMSFLWSIGAVRSDDLWNKNYELLKEYLKEHDGKFPGRSECYKGFKIGNWLIVQKSVYNNGEKCDNDLIRYNTSILTKERIDKLEELNIDWTLPKKEKWNLRYNLLVKYLKEHNGEYPKQNEIYEDFLLGAWVNTQRLILNNGTLMDDGSMQYDQLMLSKEKLEKLNEINFKRYSYNKKEYVQILKSYRKYITIKRKLNYKLDEVLDESENNIRSKEDIENINKNFEKSLTLFM